MDQEHLMKWKQEYESHRRDQLNRTKDLHKETLIRKKNMEMKAQIEAAKEEKRRQELLAERKAQHMEATMRFQRGVKNFKISKEAVNLDDVLKTMNPIRSRKNSADDRITVFNNQLANYYGMTTAPSPKMRPSSTASVMRKSSSHDNIYYDFSNRPQTQLDIHSQHQRNQIYNKYPPAFNIADVYNSNYSNYSNLYNYSSNPNGSGNNGQSYLSATNGTSSSALNNNNSSKQQPIYREALSENQRTIQEANREALREFQNIVRSELNNSKPPGTVQAPQSANPFINKMMTQQNGNHNQLEVNASAEIAGIMAGENKMDDDHISDQDSLDTDSLLNNSDNDDNGLVDRRSSPPVLVKTLANKIDYHDDGPPDFQKKQQQQAVRFNQRSESNKVNSTPATANTNPYDHLSEATSQKTEHSLSKRAEFNNYSDPLSLLLNNMQYLNFNSNENTQGKNQTNGNNPNTKNVRNHFGQADKTISTLDLNKNAVETSNHANSGPKIRSILKRSSSFDTSMNIVGQQANLVNFGLKPQKAGGAGGALKDSIELTNARINSGSRLDSATNDGRKKSVRFATQFITSGVSDQSDAKIGEEALFDNLKNNINANNNKTEPPSLSKPTLPASNPPPVPPKPSNVNQTNEANSQYSRISSANSIRRPVIKPRSTNKPPTPTTAGQQIEQPSPAPYGQQKLESPHIQINSDRSGLTSATPVDEKPPIYPINFTGQYNAGYSLMNQKRKELMTKNKNGLNSPKPPTPNGQLITSPKSANNNGYLTSPTSSDIQRQQQFNQNGTTFSGLNRPQLTQSPQTYTPKSTTTNNNHNHHHNGTNGIDAPNGVPLHHKSAFVFNDKYRLNLTDPSYANVNEQQQQQGTYDNLTQTAPAMQQYTITRIPLSPKSNLRSNYYLLPNNNSAAQQVRNLDGSSVTELRRPFSANLVPNATNIKIGNTIMSPKTDSINPYYAYANPHAPTAFQPSSNQPPQQQQAQQQRILSADSNRNKQLNPTQSIHLEIKYPLYPNAQQPTQYINISKPIRPSNQEAASENVVFLRPEEASNANFDHKTPSSRTANNQLTLSMEEQNIKNSIMRLNERLNLLSKANKNSQLNYYEMNKVNIENQNKYKKPISAYEAKMRR